MSGPQIGLEVGYGDLPVVWGISFEVPEDSIVATPGPGASPRRARSAVDETKSEVYEIFPFLAERPTQKAATLSGGERQMLAIGKALMARPRPLILHAPA